MAEGNGKALDELIQSARVANVVDEIRKQGRNVHIAAGGERFTLSRVRAEEFLTALLRIGRSGPAPPAEGTRDEEV